MDEGILPKGWTKVFASPKKGLKQIGDLFGVPVYTSKFVKRGKAYMVKKGEEHKILPSCLTFSHAPLHERYFIIHPKDRTKFYDIVVQAMNTTLKKD